MDHFQGDPRLDAALVLAHARSVASAESEMAVGLRVEPHLLRVGERLRVPVGPAAAASISTVSPALSAKRAEHCQSATDIGLDEEVHDELAATFHKGSDHRPSSLAKAGSWKLAYI